MTIITKLDGPAKELFDIIKEHLYSDELPTPNDTTLLEAIRGDFVREDAAWMINDFDHPYFPVDQWGHLRQRHWVCIEAKDSNCTLKGMAEGPCKGAFIPFNKLAALCAAHIVKFDHQVFVYGIENERYYIPLYMLPDLLQEHEHPTETAENKKWDRVDMKKVRLEGRKSIPVAELEPFRGFASYRDYLKNGLI